MKINTTKIRNIISKTSAFLIKAIAWFAVGYTITVLITNPEVQDAYQYRLNLENRLYQNEEVYKYNTWAILVNFLNEVYANDDIYLLIGGAISGIFLLIYSTIKVNNIKKGIFFILFISPLMSFNYTQILRQGLSTSVISLALVLNPGPWSFFLMGLASYTHTVFAVFVVAFISRYYILSYIQKIKRVNATLGNLAGTEKLMDYTIYFFIIPVALFLAYSYLPLEVLDKYFELDFQNIKRLPISLSLVFFILMLYPLQSLNRLFFVFSSYLIITVAYFIPFAIDYTRANVLIFPFIVFSSLYCQNKRASYFGLLYACSLNIVILYYKI